MKKNVIFAAAGALLLAVGAMATAKTQQRRKIKALWQEATAEVSGPGAFGAAN